MPDRMPDRMPEDMSDRMPEDLPVRKCINVMVGITRSKVICIGHFSLQQKGIQTTCIFAMLTRGVEKSQNALVRGRQRCTQLSIFESSLAELLCF